MTIKYSKYQEAIFEEAKNGVGNIAIKAVAGSGKTFSIVEVAQFLPRGEKIIFLAFNSHIAKELKGRLPSHIEARTFHSLGYGALVKALSRGLRIKVEGYKCTNKCSDLIKEKYPSLKWNEVKEKSSVLASIVDMARNTLTDCGSVTEVTNMCVQYGIDLTGHDPVELAMMAKEIIEWGIDFFFATGECDFTEMLYIPYIKNLEMPKFDKMLIDEAQDMNSLQIALISRCCEQGAKGIVVGDDFQSIYGFTGSLPDSFIQIQKAFNAKDMPLSICYRCPVEVIKVARMIDGNRTEWREDAPQGKVDYILQDKIPEMAQPRDLIISRLTAPLLGFAVKLIAKRVAAVVLGRNIGEQITKYIDETMKTHHGEEEPSWDDFVRRLEFFTDHNKEKISKQRNPEQQLEMLQDKFDCIMTCFNSPGFDTTTMQSFKHSIASLFSDKTSLVTLATIHRVKGLEADRVFVIMDKGGKEIMPLVWKNQLPWQYKQEMNIAYVAFTRAKKEMYLCCSNQTMIDKMKAKFSKPLAPPVPASVTEEKVYDSRFELMNDLKEEALGPPFKTTARHPEMISTPFDQDDDIVSDEDEETGIIESTPSPRNLPEKKVLKQRPDNFSDITNLPPVEVDLSVVFKGKKKVAPKPKKGFLMD